MIAWFVDILDVGGFLVAMLLVEPPRGRVLRPARGLDDDGAPPQRADPLFGESQELAPHAAALHPWIHGNPIDIVNGVGDRIVPVTDITDDGAIVQAAVVVGVLG